MNWWMVWKPEILTACHSRNRPTTPWSGSTLGLPPKGFATLLYYTHPSIQMVRKRNKQTRMPTKAHAQEQIPSEPATNNRKATIY